MAGKWAALVREDGERIVYPVGDLMEHDLHNGAECWCKPRIEDDGIFVHNSLDGREELERGLRQSNSDRRNN